MTISPPWTKDASEVYAVVDGQLQPRSLDRGDLLQYHNEVERALEAVELAALTPVFFETKALMDADLAHDAGTVAVVSQDGTAANNGTYYKTGASGAGSWVLWARSVGVDGQDGLDPGHRFTFDSNTTTTTDPGSGEFRFNNATFSNVTEIAISDNSGESGNPDVSGWLATFDDSSSTIKGYLLFRDSSAPQNFAQFSVSAATDETGFFRYTVSHVASNGTLADFVSVQFARTGDQGVSVPAGGTTGQILTKLSATDYDTTWSAPASGAASAFVTRNVSNATALAAETDGTIGAMEGFFYKVDSTKTGTDSATNDLGVDGLIPWGYFVAPEHFGDGSGDTDWHSEIEKAIAFAKDSNEPRIVKFQGKTYNWTTPDHIQMETGVIFQGAGMAGTRLRYNGVTYLGAMFRFADESETSDYFRFVMRDLWLDGNNNVSSGVRLVGLRFGRFENVELSGTNDNGWFIKGDSYYNTWINCNHSGSGRGWIIYNDGTFAANENHWYSCRKNTGTVGWYISAINANLNSAKLVNCIVEGHTGDAVTIYGDATAGVYNTILTGFRADSSSGGDSVNITSQYCYHTTVQDIYEEGTGLAALVNNGTHTAFLGYPYTVEQTASNPAFGMVSGYNYKSVDITITNTQQNIQPDTWGAEVYISSGALNMHLQPHAKVVGANLVRIILRNHAAGNLTPASINYHLVVRRIN